MQTLYAMQRANGDWFTMNINGKTCIPLFRNSFLAERAYTTMGEFLVYRPHMFTQKELNQVTAAKNQSSPVFWLVDENDTALNLRHGTLVDASYFSPPG